MATRLKWNSASKKKRKCSKYIRSLSLHDLEVSTATTAWLSLWHWIQRPDQRLPQTAAATTMGRSFYVAMLIALISEMLSQASWNHSVSQYAPQPQLLEPSDVKVLSGTHLPAKDNRLVPFHPSKNECHQSMLNHALLLMLSLLTDLLRAIS